MAINRVTIMGNLTRDAELRKKGTPRAFSPSDSKGAGKDTVSAQGQSAEPETYDADIPF